MIFALLKLKSKFQVLFFNHNLWAGRTWGLSHGAGSFPPQQVEERLNAGICFLHTRYSNISHSDSMDLWKHVSTAQSDFKL